MNNLSTNYVVVIVDDEEMVLTSLSSFLSLETEYEVKTFTLAKEALKFVRDNHVDLVISDYLMPEMDGLAWWR
jgi:YesN/AraC family two-component response regulator